MKLKMVIFFTFFLLVFVPVYTSTLLSAAWKIHSEVRVVSLGVVVYEDAAGSINLTEINWGDIEAGNYSERLIYCELTGNVNAKLYLSAMNYTPPEAGAFFELSWDYDNSTLVPGVLYPIVLTLSISESVVDVYEFSFDILIVAVEEEG